MADKKLVNEVGNYVVRERFWDRVNELSALTNLIDEGQHVSIIAQRRVGKTSLMWETADQIKDRFYCVMVDVQDASTPADAIVSLCMATKRFPALWACTLHMLSTLMPGGPDTTIAIPEDELRIKLRSVLGGDWKSGADNLLDHLASADMRVVVFIDELPILINRVLRKSDRKVSSEGRAGAELFLSWLRAASLRHKGHIVFVVAGSIGLGPVLKMAGLSATMTTFTPFELGAWDSETAKGCLDSLAANYGISFQMGATDKVIERLGSCIPHHVQMCFSHIRADASSRKTSLITQADVERVYLASMLRVRGHLELSHMEERLRLVLDADDVELVTELLCEAALGRLDDEAARFLSARSPREGTPVGERLSNLLGLLEHDGYVERRRDRYVFVSNLLKDWWRACYGKIYVPVRRRTEGAK